MQMGISVELKEEYLVHVKAYQKHGFLSGSEESTYSELSVRCHDLPLEPCAILICCPLALYISVTPFQLISLLLQNSYPPLRIIKHLLSHIHFDISE